MPLEGRAKLHVFKLPGGPYLILRDRNYTTSDNLPALPYSHFDIHATFLQLDKHTFWNSA